MNAPVDRAQVCTRRSPAGVREDLMASFRMSLQEAAEVLQSFAVSAQEGARRGANVETIRHWKNARRVLIEMAPLIRELERLDNGGMPLDTVIGGYS